MGIGDFANQAKGFADQHDEQVDQGLDRAGDTAKDRFAGHDSQIDSAVDRAQQATGDGDTGAAAVPPPTEGAQPAAEAPGNSQADVPAGPGEVPPQQ